MGRRHKMVNRWRGRRQNEIEYRDGNCLDVPPPGTARCNLRQFRVLCTIQDRQVRQFPHRHCTQMPRCPQVQQSAGQRRLRPLARMSGAGAGAELLRILNFSRQPPSSLAHGVAEQICTRADTAQSAQINMTENQSNYNILKCGAWLGCTDQHTGSGRPDP